MANEQSLETYRSGKRVVSRFEELHMIKRTEVDSRGQVWLLLVDGREFSAEDFSPYVIAIHAGNVEICTDCFKLPC